MMSPSLISSSLVSNVVRTSMRQLATSGMHLRQAGSRAVHVRASPPLRHVSLLESTRHFAPCTRTGFKAQGDLLGVRGLHLNRLLATQNKAPSHHTSMFGAISWRTAKLDGKESSVKDSHAVTGRQTLCTKPQSQPPQLEPDSLARWPDWTPGGMLRAGDYFGTAVFSMTGCLTAATHGMDLLGCAIVGTITAVGGGTIRDFLIGHEDGKPKRAFWMDEEEYLWISIGSAVLTFFLWDHFAERLGLSEDDFWVFFSDSLGIGVFCCVGAMNGVRAGLSIPLSAICGMITSTFGGLTRDVLTKRPVRILHSHVEIYATAAFAGASAYLLARRAGLGLAMRGVAGFCTAFALRAAAWTYDVRLPQKDRMYKHDK